MDATASPRRWQILQAAAAICSVAATISTQMLKSNNIDERVARAEAVKAWLEVLDLPPATGQLTPEQVATEYAACRTSVIHLIWCPWPETNADVRCVTRSTSELRDGSSTFAILGCRGANVGRRKAAEGLPTAQAQELVRLDLARTRCGRNGRKTSLQPSTMARHAGWKQREISRVLEAQEAAALRLRPQPL